MNLLKKMLMGGLAAMLLLGGVTESMAQGKKFKTERRIFLWDVTISMVGATNESPNRVERNEARTNPFFDYKKSGWGYDESRDIFDDTRASLLNYIDGIEREDCEIFVIPYTTDIQSVYYVGGSTAEDKADIKRQVMSWDNLKAGGTYTGTCLQKVVNSYFDPEKMNKVILLTDGRPSSGDGNKLYDIVASWDEKHKENDYIKDRILYVKLTQEAKDAKIDTLASNQQGVTVIEPGTKIDEVVTFTLRDYKYKIFVNEYVGADGELVDGGVIEIGCDKTGGVGLDKVICSFTCDENPYISLDATRVAPMDGKFAIPFTFKTHDRQFYLESLPDGVDKVMVKCEVLPSCDNVMLEDSDQIEVELIVKLVPRATISLSTK